MRSIILLLMALSVAGLMGGVLIVAGCFLYLNPQLPSTDEFRNIRLQVPLRIYSNDGQIIAEYGNRRRIPQQLNKLPERYIKAVLAIEDKRFYSHSGVDFISLLNAARRLLASKQIRGGGSTITMQVTRNVVLGRQKTFIRKFKEILLALQLEREMSKEDILELYVNLIPFGKHAYGVVAAAQIYYGKQPNDLSLAQLAMLAGIPQAPSLNNPINGPQKALKRRNLVLQRMHQQGSISQSEYDQAISEPLTASIHSLVGGFSAPWMAEKVRTQMLHKFGYQVYEDGYQVHTTLDIKMQKASDAAVRRGIYAYDLRHGYRGATDSLTVPVKIQLAPPDSQLTLPPTWQQALKTTKSFANLIPAVVARVNEQSFAAFLVDGNLVQIKRPGFEWARPFFNVNSKGRKPATAGDVVKLGELIWLNQEDEAWVLRQVPQVQMAAIIIAPKNGAVLAMNGGFDFKHSQFNHALQAKRQPGSGFKPFVYAAALEQGGATPATMVNDAPLVFEDQNLEGKYRPKNSSGDFRGPIRLREALYSSANLASIRVLLKVTPATTLQFLPRFGFDTSNFPENLQLALGGGTIGLTPLEIARAYTPFANGGYLIKPYFITRIERNGSGVIEEYQPAIACDDCLIPDASDATKKDKTAPKILDPRVAFQIKTMLQDVIRRGTGKKAQSLKRIDLAGKTGTTDESDAWFNGFNDDLVASVWIGLTNNSPLGDNEFGSNAALPVWIDFMSQILPPDQTGEAALVPPGMLQIHIDPKTGKPVAPTNPEAELEWFRSEKAPPPITLPNAVENETGIDPAELF